MVTMQSRLQKLHSALVAIDDLDVYHYWRPVMSAPYLVWQEEEGESHWSGNRATEITIIGSLHYFTQTEFDPMVDSIQGALNSVDICGWRLESVQYEDETNLIHYEWRFEIG